jgi:hypothetical protein
VAEHKSVSSLIKAISERGEKLSDTSNWREPLTRIGVQVAALAKLNIRRWGMIDTGALLNSIRYELYQSGSDAGVEIGSYGVPYAQILHFGGPITDAMRRAMFASLKARGSKVSRPSKGFVKKGRFPKRPYLTSALVQSRAMVIDVLRGAVRK